MPTITFTPEACADMMAQAARAEMIARDAIITAESLFVDSAIYAARTVKGGAQVKAIADAAAALVKADASLKSATMYTSPAAVGYHVRTGRVLLIDLEDGDDVLLPEGVTAQDVQTLVKGLSTRIVDAIIGSAVTTADAYAALLKAARKVAADRRKADKVKADAAADKVAADVVADMPEAVPASAADLLGDALGLILSAAESAADWDEDARKVAAEILSILSPITAEAESVA